MEGRREGGRGEAKLPTIQHKMALPNTGSRNRFMAHEHSSILVVVVNFVVERWIHKFFYFYLHFSNSFFVNILSYFVKKTLSVIGYEIWWYFIDHYKILFDYDVALKDFD